MARSGRTGRNAREDVLARIRAALANGEAASTDVPRRYRTESHVPEHELVSRLLERLTDYGAGARVIERSGLAAAVLEACQRRAARRIAVPSDLPETWTDRLKAQDAELLRDLPGTDALSNAALDGVDGVLTGCALAIAATGTIVLDGGPTQGRRALTLLPDWHLCVVHADRLVASVPQAIARLRVAALEGRPITLISGPSATSDIELSRVEGVHGPRTLDVLIVTDGSGASHREPAQGPGTSPA